MRHRTASLATWKRLTGFRLRMQDYLRGGLSAEDLALTIALGATCGLFPVFGATTALCAAAGVLFRLNPVVIQVVNYLMYPIYFFFMFAFIVAGAWVFGESVDPASSISLRDTIEAGGWAAMARLGRALFHAVLVWLVVAPFAVLGLRCLMRPVTRRWAKSAGR